MTKGRDRLPRTFPNSISIKTVSMSIRWSLFRMVCLGGQRRRKLKWVEVTYDTPELKNINRSKYKYIQDDNCPNKTWFEYNKKMITCNLWFSICGRLYLTLYHFFVSVFVKAEVFPTKYQQTDKKCIQQVLIKSTFLFNCDVFASSTYNHFTFLPKTV